MNPYEVLEISPGASPEEIKAAYHRMAKLWHPDRFTGAAKVEAEGRFRQLAEAFGMLKDVARPELPVVAKAAAEPAAAAPIQLDQDTSGGSQGRVKTADDWFQDAKSAFEARAYGRALALILYALRMEDGRADFHAFHGKVLEASGGEVRTKVKALETAIRLNPKDFDSMILLAQAYQNLGMQARATRLWNTLHDQVPDHAIFSQPAKGQGKKGSASRDQAQLLGEQFSALVADARITLGRIFKRG